MKKLIVLVAWLALAAGALAKPSNEDKGFAGVEIMANRRSGDFDLAIVGESWTDDYFSVRGGMSLLGVRRTEGVYGTIFGGMRLSLPLYVSPFVGFSVVVGRGNDRKSEEELAREKEYERRYPYSTTTNSNEKYYPYTYMVGCYPEAGVRVWLGNRMCATASIRYFVSSLGRTDDRTLCGGSVVWNF
jgi:hypothetical protein